MLEHCIVLIMYKDCCPSNQVLLANSIKIGITFNKKIVGVISKKKTRNKYDYKMHHLKCKYSTLWAGILQCCTYKIIWIYLNMLKK